VQIETLTYNERHSAKQTMTVDKKEGQRSRNFYLIFACAQQAHLQSRTSKRTDQSFAKELALPTRKGQGNFTFMDIYE